MRPDVLILARAGRQLAQASCAGGYSPVVIDFFGDSDTRRSCLSNVVLKPGEGFRFDAAELLTVLADLRSRYGLVPLVWGSGWEAQPHLLAAIAQAWPMKGSPIAALFAATNPLALQQALGGVRVAIPSVVFGEVPKFDRWLIKRSGSSGGYGVMHAGRRWLTGQREYFQRELSGTVHSAVFVAGNGKARLLGVCEAFNLQSSRTHPFRFSAAIACGEGSKKRVPQLMEIAAGLTKAWSLRGLFGIDFIDSESGDLVLLELNARPAATFDLVVDPGAAFAAHMNPDTLAYGALRLVTDIRAMAIYYADDPIVIPKTLNWPAWVADRPALGSRINPGMPVCSISSAAATREQARALLEQRFDEIRSCLSS